MQDYNMPSPIVKNWFAEDFSKLAPELQDLHQHGGKLLGKVDVVLGKGLAGVIGKRLQKKLNLPAVGTNDLCVTISHSDVGLHWDRKFNNTTEMKSTFEPINTIKDGYWIEKTGPLQMKLTVDIKDHGWYWRCLSFSLFGVPLPVWLFPKSKAYKYIEEGGYKFYVGFEAPVIGLLLSYSGTLQKQSVAE